MEIEFRRDREAHLRKLCREMGRSVDDFVNEALLRSMEDYEDGRDAQEVSARLKTGEETTISLEELMQRYAMEDRDFENRGEATGSTGQANASSHHEVSAGKSSHAA